MAEPLHLHTVPQQGGHLPGEDPDLQYWCSLPRIQGYVLHWHSRPGPSRAHLCWKESFRFRHLVRALGINRINAMSYINI